MGRGGPSSSCASSQHLAVWVSRARVCELLPAIHRGGGGLTRNAPEVGGDEFQRPLYDTLIKVAPKASPC